MPSERGGRKAPDVRRREGRRSFLSGGGFALAATFLSHTSRADRFLSSIATESRSPAFHTDTADLANAYTSALQCLKANTARVFRFADPVLIEGSTYRGVWLECAPHEGLVYSLYDPAVGAANHRIFFELQREDGYLPCNVKADSQGTGQIQMVVPIAATALELFERFGDSQFLELAYHSCSAWDAWLRRYRNTRGTGLCEGFCEYDTGHDNSPRWRGVPKQCPDKDARLLPPASGLPRLCPDLSASVYGGRMALAKMARIMGRATEADDWEESAHVIRKAILELLYEAEDACFYDLDAENRFVRIRGDLLTRVLSEHVVDQPQFERIYEKQIHSPTAFWAPFPLPSIALDDPSFVRPIPRNSWGGASQALTALRAPRWMEHYGKPADLAHMMRQWVKAILEASGFWGQQMDPFTGQFTTPDPGGYSPAALVLLDYVWRLFGVRCEGQRLEWNCRCPVGASFLESGIWVSQGTARLRNSKTESVLTLGSKTILRVSGTVRVWTDLQGRVTHVSGTELEAVEVRLHWPSGARKAVKVLPNSNVSVTI